MSGKQRIDGAAAFLLHAHPYSETSLLLDVFVRTHGRLALLARGARRPRSALRGVLLGFQPLELSWFGGGEVKTLAKAEWMGGLPLLNGKCLLLGYYLNELLLKLMPREDAHPALYDAYADALGALSRGGAEAAELRRFEKTLLRELGYGLALDREAGSGEPVQADRQYLYLIERGAVAARGDEDAPAISGKTLLDLAKDDYGDPRTLAEAKGLMRQLVAHYLGGQALQSRRVFVGLKNYENRFRRCFMIELGVNIDHVATIRQARRTYEPDPVWAAVEAHLGGADGITVHLREDRRHIQDHDVRRLRELTHIKLNLEMAATGEMVGIACELKPEMAMLVPEGRHEITTEGGLDVVGQEAKLKDAVSRLAAAGIVTSVFIDAELPQVEAAARIGARVCEIHTGPYAHAFHERGRDAESPAVLAELEKIRTAGNAIRELGMRFNAGHALNYFNVQPVARLDGVRELHIGHAIVSRAVFVGMREAVREMKRLMREAASVAA